MNSNPQDPISVEGFGGVPALDTRHLVTRLVFESVAFAVLAAAAYTAIDFLDRARWFPQYMAIAGMALLAIQIVLDLVALRRMRRSADPAAPSEPGHGWDQAALVTETDLPDGVGPKGRQRSTLNPTVRVAVWLLGYLGVVALVGLPIASPLFVAAYSHLEAGMKWQHTTAVTIFTIVVIWFFVSQGHLYLPPSLLF